MVWKKILTAVAFFTLYFTGQLQAQKRQLEYSGFFDSYYFRGPWAITAGFGMAGYNGDICGGLKCNTLRYVYSLGLNYKVWPRTVFGAELSYFNLQATDNNAQRNISFTSTNYELDVYGRFYFVEDIVRVAADRSRKPKRLKPYVHLGIGGLLYNPVSTYGPLTDSANILSEGRTYPGITFVIPAGFGLSYSFSHRVSILAELTYKYTFTDYLDDVGAVRGKSTGLNDSYGMFNLKLQLAPWAPKVKRKKKYHGTPPDSNGGGGEGGTAPAEKTGEQNKAAEGGEKPEGGENPQDGEKKEEETAPAQELQEEKPAQDSLQQEQSQEQEEEQKKTEDSK